MKRIYAHIGNSSINPHFDPENLRNSQQSELGVRDKPSYGLWASPFNDKNACPWEWFLASEMNPNANRHARALEEAESTKFGLFLRSNFVTDMQYRRLPSDQRIKLYEDYKKLPPSYTKEEMDQAVEQDRQNQLRYGADSRKNAFYFTVDQSKILHINSSQDIEPYLRSDEMDLFAMFNQAIDFDKIKADGYDGVELHNARQMRNLIGNPFYTWDVDSIVVWNSECVHPVEKEIAYIARSIADSKNEFDVLDPMADDVALTRWLADNIPTIEGAIKDGALTKEEIGDFIERAIELDNQRRGLSSRLETLKQQDNEIEIER